MTRILVINQPLDNRGDEAAHKALMRSLAACRDDFRIRVLFVGANPDSVRQFRVKDDRIEYVNVSHKIMWKFSQYAKKGIEKPFLRYVHPIIREVAGHYAWADIALSSPGGICMGGFQNWKHLFFLEMAKWMQKPVFYYGRSIGPFPESDEEGRSFKTKSLELLNYCSFISLREEKSMKLAREMGFEKAILTTDTAFLDSPEAAIPEDMASKLSGSPYVVFVPNLLIWHGAYKGKASREEVTAFWVRILDIIRHRFAGHRIVLLPQLFNVGEAGDEPFFREMTKADGGEDLIVVPESFSSDVQQAVIRGASALFGARYHSVVFAINNDVPFLAFSYEHKISGLLKTLGIDYLSIDIEDLFDSPGRGNVVLEDFDSTIVRLSRNPDAATKAKKMARDCFETFLTAVHETNHGA